MFNFCLSSPLLALLAVYTVGSVGHEEAVTTAPIYLPYYDKESWSLMRGSIIASNPEEHQTAYTIFCPNDNPPECDISLEFPFVVIEGPDTIQFHGTYTSTYIANLQCTLKGTTVATCSGYSSYKDGYTNGPHTGPTEVSWTSTYSGTDVEWGILTMAEVPKETAHEWDVTAVAGTTPTTGPEQANTPLATDSESSSTTVHIDRRIYLAGGLGGFILVGLLF
ncbi:hypothetical protein B0T10DRAFT_214445 [Thelonectria olida]|uniref:Uncharacterized protein n=1 Tax=Thelonectria olida TaxID=1576542 RepID=A0A9P8WC16_9HYPO|nr:hypothetical protein B0T10DRAFT_214445 [Thelonectria olida]